MSVHTRRRSRSRRPISPLKLTGPADDLIAQMDVCGPAEDNSLLTRTLNGLGQWFTHMLICFLPSTRRVQKCGGLPFAKNY